MDEFRVEDVEKAVEAILLRLPPPKVDEKRKPIAVVLGGQPGAGKSALQDIAKQNIPDIIIINGDEYRKYHPNFDEIYRAYGDDFPKHTAEFSGKVTEVLKAKLMEQKRNILVEGTLRTASVPLETCRAFKENGYNVMLGIMAVKPEISYLSTILRYENMNDLGMVPRKTAKDHHDLVVRNLPANLKEICETGEFDKVVIYNRRRQCISQNSHKQPYEVLQDVLHGAWSKAELENYIEVYEETRRLKEKRKANDLEEFVNEYGTIYNQAKEKLSEHEKKIRQQLT